MIFTDRLLTMQLHCRNRLQKKRVIFPLSLDAELDEDGAHMRQ